jgi:general secretion pathway protein N
MRLSWKGYVAVGVVTLFVGLVIMFPARVAYNWFAPPGIALSGIDGTIWHGSAAAGMAGGLYLTNVDWKMQPGKLLRGRVGYGVEADASSGFMKTDIALGSGGRASLSNLSASLSLASLQEFVRMPGLSGALSLRFERLDLENGLPVAAAGTAEIANLRAPLIHREPIGGFRAEFFTQDSGVVASVEDTQASIDMAGSLTISSDRTYQFIGKVAPKDDTPDRLREQMKFLGSPNDRGQFDMRLEGQL